MRVTGVVTQAGGVLLTATVQASGLEAALSAVRYIAVELIPGLGSAPGGAAS